MSDNQLFSLLPPADLMLVFVFRFPVVAMGVLKWVDWTVSEPRYFQLQTDHTPVHLALLDEVRHQTEPLISHTPPPNSNTQRQLSSDLHTSATQICTCHQLLHPQVLQLLIKLFETEHSQLDVMEQVRCVTDASPLGF